MRLEDRNRIANALRTLAADIVDGKTKSVELIKTPIVKLGEHDGWQTVEPTGEVQWLIRITKYE